MVLELGGIAVLDGIAVTESHQGAPGDSTSLAEGLQISPTGPHNGMVQKKWKWKPWRQQSFRKCWAQEQFEVEKVGRKSSVDFNHVDSNHINPDSNHSNQIKFIQLIPTSLTTINDSADVCELNQLFSCYGDSIDAGASKISTRTPLNYIPSIHTAHTNSPVHSLHSYLLVPTLQKFTYQISDPSPPLHDSLAESATPTDNPMLRRNPPNSVQKVPADLDSDPSFSYCSLLDSYDSPEDE